MAAIRTPHLTDQDRRNAALLLTEHRQSIGDLVDLLRCTGLAPDPLSVSAQIKTATSPDHDHKQRSAIVRKRKKRLR